MVASRMKWIALLALSVLSMVLSGLSYGYFYDERLERHFDQITLGLNEQQVIAKMGKPDSIGACGELGGHPDACDREYLYGDRLPTIRTRAVFFDVRGQAIGKYTYDSP
jgi:hypothetical protein